MEGAAADAATAEEHHAISFPEQPEEEHEPSRLEQERAKHKARAEKFGTEYVEPSRRRDLRLDARKERFTRPGFATGIDLFTEEERQKREQRAARFGLPEGSGLEWKPPQVRAARGWGGPWLCRCNATEHSLEWVAWRRAELPALLRRVDAWQVSEDDEKRRQRAERFGVDYKPKDETGLMDVDLFESRRDPGVAAARRPEALHIYGVDLLSTGDILKYFADYGPKYVEWINDSSANVLFADAPTAKRAVAGMGKPLPPEDAPEQMGIDPSDPASLQFLWHKGGDFVKAGTPIPLIFRIATVEDVRPADRVPSRRLWLTASGGSRGGGQQQPRHQQQQGGGGGQGEEGEGHQQRGRGRRRYKPRTGGRPAGWQHDDRGDGEGGDVHMGQQRKARRPRNKWRRQGGDVEMEDADAYDGDGGGYQDGGGTMTRFRAAADDERPALAAAAAAAAPAGPPREQVSYGDL
ncbi:hypothetical protein CHLNCDRAFT_137920 [Chlorella variabilis]|uniref:Nuclear cap-binding protein subunit 3 n=1 Tax=Chlorella variabilis TaxID=554065 RepID=E1Z4U5_CHLVA|nr:hypothetical protein CHLNCDRAFT_137920 [Chlorella variabilis]EFN59407.1 hypothetical protein CHLNCDRAFT_137920 [Chlorella variabilis]|eukprot:XP_005851509.1 hypothetical protein CHLNCDRAFT_137920 [Chlorella variabilis]